MTLALGVPGLSIGRGGLTPSLNLQFANHAAVDSRVTFTRASTASYIDSTGVIASAAINTPRIDYDPSTLACKGLLIEEQRTNLLLYSEQFDNGVWGKTDSSVTSNAATAPDGALTADKLVASATTGSHYILQTVSGGVSGTAYTVSTYAKAAELPSVRIEFVNGAFPSSQSARFNASAGTSAVVSGSPTVTMTSVGGGYYRCAVTATAAANGAFQVLIFASQAATDSYTGDGTSGIYIWGAQLEAGAFPTSYIPTTSSQVTRSADVATMTGSNFSSWYRQDQGSFVAEWSMPAIYSTAASTFAVIDDGTGNNELMLRTNTAHTSAAYNASCSSTALTTLNNGTLGTAPAVNVAAKQAIAYLSGDSGAAFNGASGLASSTAFAGLVATTLRIGNNRVSTQPANGHIRRIAYYPQRLTNTQLQALTA